MAEVQRLILASGSRARQAMLKRAGLTFEVVPASIDEEAIRAALQGESARVEAADVATLLACEKALAVAKLHPGALVIGSDQVLTRGRRFYSKAVTLQDARATLRELRGRKHELVSGVALAKDEAILWSHEDSAEMTMREFSDPFLSRYLEEAGESILRSVGCYEWEGLGVQLFKEISGDYFTILGMPLLPLLGELRRQGVLAT